MLQPITLCVVTDACKEFGNNIYQALISRFILWNRTLSGRQVQQSFSIISVYHSYGPARFSSSLARTPCCLMCRTSSCITTFRRIFLVSGDINHILWKKMPSRLLRINIARINTREVIKSVSSLSYFSKLCGFVIWIFSVSGLNSWF